MSMFLEALDIIHNIILDLELYCASRCPIAMFYFTLMYYNYKMYERFLCRVTVVFVTFFVSRVLT